MNIHFSGEPLNKKSNRTKKQVTIKSKGQKGKLQKTTKEKSQLSSPKDYCTAAESPSTCHCQLCISRAFEPMEVSFIVYNANSSELSQPQQQDTDVMDVTESYGMKNFLFYHNCCLCRIVLFVMQNAFKMSLVIYK